MVNNAQEVNNCINVPYHVGRLMEENSHVFTKVSSVTFQRIIVLCVCVRVCARGHVCMCVCEAIPVAGHGGL
jgi:hypothetical protein